jgi:hypothetical protein
VSDRKLKLPRGCLVLLCIVFPIVLCYLWVAFETRRAQSRAKKRINPGRPASELLEFLGKPLDIWQGRGSVPQRFQEELGDAGLSNAVFFSYAREGLPCWSILIAINPDTSNVLWGTVTHP